MFECTSVRLHTQLSSDDPTNWRGKSPGMVVESFIRTVRQNAVTEENIAPYLAVQCFASYLPLEQRPAELSVNQKAILLSILTDLLQQDGDVGRILSRGSYVVGKERIRDEVAWVELYQKVQEGMILHEVELIKYENIWQICKFEDHTEF